MPSVRDTKMNKKDVVRGDAGSHRVDKSTSRSSLAAPTGTKQTKEQVGEIIVYIIPFPLAVLRQVLHLR